MGAINLAQAADIPRFRFQPLGRLARVADRDKFSNQGLDMRPPDHEIEIMLACDEFSLPAENLVQLSRPGALFSPQLRALSPGCLSRQPVNRSPAEQRGSEPTLILGLHQFLNRGELLP
jgi:hypothetical protein